jgi:hypothetical protein
MSNRIRRSFASLSIAALCAAIVFVGGSGTALARADCLQSDPEADVFVTITSLTTSQLTAVVTDIGPCNVPDASVAFTFPAGSVVSSVTSNPAAWNCVGVGTDTVTCPSSGGSAPTIGVPGNHDFNVFFTLGPAVDQTITAQVIVGGGPSSCTDGNASTTCDPDPDNNTIWALAVGAGSAGSLTTCPSKPCTQYTDMSVPAGGSGGTVQIQQSASLCPSGFPNSFGKCVSINSPIVNAAGTVTTLVLTIDASLAHGAYGGVNVINSTDGSAWSLVPNCSKNSPTYPCVFLKTKFKVGTITYIQFVIHKTLDDGWGFDG